MLTNLKGIEDLHIGRSWHDHTLEDACPCPQEKCGLVAYNRINPECDQHPMGKSKTIRQSHSAAQCAATSI